MGAIAALVFGSNSVIAAALSQLMTARVSIPVWIPLCGAAAVCVFRELIGKRFDKHFDGNTATAMAVIIIVMALIFTAALLLTKVNGVFIHVAIGIIRMLLGSGAF